MGSINYMTGGTTGTPRLITYDRERWNRSVTATAQVLEAHGVAAGSRVLVMQPFAPWAIGQVFSEAALACGADVFPIGLYSLQEPFTIIVDEIDPTHYCATAHNMLKLHSQLSAFRNGTSSQRTCTTIFSAGEPVSALLRHECQTAWRSAFVNIYGMSEFDTLAADCPGDDSLTLLSDYEYCLLVGSRHVEPAAGVEGELCVKSRTSSWQQTGDLVKILGPTKSRHPSWRGSWTLALVGRKEEALSLSDGTSISASQVHMLSKQFPSIRRLQLHLRRGRDGDHVSLACVLADDTVVPDPGSIKNYFLQSSIDVFDSHRQRILVSIDVNFVSDAQLIATARGKTPLMLEI